MRKTIQGNSIVNWKLVSDKDCYSKIVHNKEFTKQYQSALLLSLYERQFLSQEQYTLCLEKLNLV